MRWLIFIMALLLASQSWAASPIVRDGKYIQSGDETWVLEGIDAPDLDQICIDAHAATWNCGVAARDRLASMIGSHEVLCRDSRIDPGFSGRHHRGICTVEGEIESLNQLLVRQGFALNRDGPFKDAEADARGNHRGLWQGCFAAPEASRHRYKDSALLGASCRTGNNREIPDFLFAEPSGCRIKGKFARRTRVTTNVGIYQMQGCPDYPALAAPDRWFCSEKEALAAGFRRASNCPANAGDRNDTH
jgi:endonuclease YncB( thermonuclease family)